MSQLVQVNPLYRKYRKAKTLLATLQKKREFLKEHINPGHERRFHFVTVDLKIFVSQLDSKEFISHTPKWVGWPVKDVVNYVFQGINRDGAPAHTPLEKAACDLMTELGRMKAVSQHKFLICSEIAHRADQGWYFVFNTLTVREGALESVFNPNSLAFKNYIQRIDRDVRKSHLAAGGNPDDETHTYFAVTEFGGQSGRLHIHCLHACRALPLGARCPNVGRARPSLRQIDRFRRYWEHGFSTPIAVRYSANDAYGKAGWRWPLDPKTGIGLRSNSPLRIAGYMSKYVLKAYHVEAREDYKWRIKKNHRYGLAIIKELVSSLTISTLTAMSTADQITATMNGGQVPKNLLRREVLNRLQSIHGTQAQFEHHKDLPSQPGLLTRIRDLTEASLSSSLSSSTVSSAPGTSLEAISKAQAELSAVAAQLDQRYFYKSTFEPKANDVRPH